jgi:hypothetical protein
MDLSVSKPAKEGAPLILLELNELNFEYVEHYGKNGELPTLNRLFDRYGYRITRSEQVYEHIEPWIQWVSAHTGKTFGEHGIFRLGDVREKQLDQIWEVLEKRGLKVAAFSPMNAQNTLEAPAFFVPDPWTPARVSGSPLLRGFFSAVGQAVNENAQARFTLPTLAWLLAGFVVYARKARLYHYLSDAARAPRAHWTKAVFLDRLLADCFLKLWRSTRPDFASFFVNGAAHIQHHYLFNSAAYRGSHRNPTWYVAPGEDPVLEIYRLYDRVVADCMALDPQPRIMIATGLHQDPVDQPVYYWRLKDHARFLRTLGLRFQAVEPRMSRDFLVTFGNAADAAEAAALLASGRDRDGMPLFEVDNRGTSLFVMLTYPDAIESGFTARFDRYAVENFAAHVVFVAIKNSHHNDAGYFLDTGAPAQADASEMPLTDVWQRVQSAF